MPRTDICLATICLFATGLLPACSSQQLYASGQSWRQQECGKIADTEERRRCTADANTSYENYQRQREAVQNSR